MAGIGPKFRAITVVRNLIAERISHQHDEPLRPRQGFSFP